MWGVLHPGGGLSSRIAVARFYFRTTSRSDRHSFRRRIFLRLPFCEANAWFRSRRIPSRGTDLRVKAGEMQYFHGHRWVSRLAFIVAVSRRGSSTRPRKLGMILFIRIFKTGVVRSLIEAYPLRIASRRTGSLLCLHINLRRILTRAWSLAADGNSTSAARCVDRRFNLYIAPKRFLINDAW